MNCQNEIYLNRKENSSEGFKLDLHITRQRVASGAISVAVGVEKLQEEELKKFTPNIANELELCLHRIADGNCTKYPKIIN